MKVVIQTEKGEIQFDGKDVPVLIILDEHDKFNLSHLAEDNNMYCCYPDYYTPETIKKFLVKYKEHKL